MPQQFVVLNTTGRYYSNLYSIVINITDGVIQGVTWDDTCYCSADQCMAVSFLDLNTTEAQNTNDYLCNEAVNCWGTASQNTTDCDPKV